MPNETMQREEEIGKQKNPFPRPAFVVLPKEEQEKFKINEVETEKIPVTAIEEINHAEIEMKEEIKKDEPKKEEITEEKVIKEEQAAKEENKEVEEMEEIEEIEQLELIPNGFSGMYILITILMVMMIGISILGFILS